MCYNYIVYIILIVNLLINCDITTKSMGVMVTGSMLALSTVDRGFESRSGLTKDYKIGICCISSKNTALKSKSKDWLALVQNNVSEWSDMSTCGRLFQ